MPHTAQPAPPPSRVELAAIERWLAAARAKRVKESAPVLQRSTLDPRQAVRGQIRWVAPKKGIE